MIQSIVPKDDIRQVNSVATYLDMTEEERRGFGRYLEQCKKHGDLGSKERGDFNRSELIARGEEFLRSTRSNS